MIKGERLRKLRKTKGYTLEELGDMLGNMSKSTISNYENEKREPSREVVIKIMQIFDCTADYLIGADHHFKTVVDEDYAVRVLEENEIYLLDEINKDEDMRAKLIKSRRGKEIIDDILKKLR